MNMPSREEIERELKVLASLREVIIANDAYPERDGVPPEAHAIDSVSEVAKRYLAVKEMPKKYTACTNPDYSPKEAREHELQRDAWNEACDQWHMYHLRIVGEVRQERRYDEEHFDGVIKHQREQLKQKDAEIAELKRNPFPNAFTYQQDLLKEIEQKDARIEELERALRIESSEPEERSQESAHYIWLDDQNEKIQQENEQLRKDIDECMSNVETTEENLELAHKERDQLKQQIAGMVRKPSVEELNKIIDKIAFQGIDAEQWGLNIAEIAEAILDNLERGEK